MLCGYLKSTNGLCGEDVTTKPDNLPTLDSKNPTLGTHIIADLHGATNLIDGPAMFAAIRQAAELAGAVVVGERHHMFGPDEGVTGVVLLAESHISIHTWPENAFAALDIFMCGDRVDADKALAHLKAYFQPSEVKVTHLSRG